MGNNFVEERARRTKWFLQDRFGMFIHWGLYAIPARGEWVRSVEQMPEEEYLPFFEEFDPVHFEPEKWAKAAKQAGMKYAVLTAKHHDGFCLFDSKHTDFKSTNTKSETRPGTGISRRVPGRRPEGGALLLPARLAPQRLSRLWRRQPPDAQ